MTTNAIQATNRSRPGAVSRMLGKNPITRIGFWLMLLVIVIYLLFPFYWAFRTSITPDNAQYTTPVQYFPASPTLKNYGDVFSNGNFVHALLNSAIVGVAVTVLSLIVGASAAYALARFNFRGRSFMTYLILSMTIFPPGRRARRPLPVDQRLPSVRLAWGTHH